MSKRRRRSMTIEEAQEFLGNKERQQRIRRKHEGIGDIPEEFTPGGYYCVPTNDLELARIKREIRDGGADDSHMDKSDQDQ